MKVPKLLTSIGPAVIVASIVLGPGSILTSSKVGCQYGYGMLWVLVAAVALMIGTTALASFLGVVCSRTVCGELAHRGHRYLSAAVGIVVFLVVACFQSSNNSAVVASIEGFAAAADSRSEQVAASELPLTAKLAVLFVMNAVIIATLCGFRRLYRPLETLMLVLVLGMLAAFTMNLYFAQPSLAGIARGLIPQFPFAQQAAGTAEPVERSAMPIWALLGLVATTFSVAGAFYQSYLVREKGWAARDIKKGLTDSVIGITLLGFVSAVIMVTSAAALHGTTSYRELQSVADIARQLSPLFGPAATWLFSFGIFAAAFSSFLGNALVGGTVLADGLGLGSSMDEVWPKRLTIAALVVGMLVAMAAAVADANPVGVIMFAQALTILGGPALAILLVWLGFQLRGQGIPAWVLLLGGCGVVTQLLLAGRTFVGLLD